ncbi:MULTISPECIES: SulP family inorganic anion transporter [Empedobacter]|uniref:Sulfate transporter ychM n=1 Tax=Empedobacter falsenii TaxID=343874 RepID=A0A376G616_9FLAO|nr:MULTISPECIES: SulP family inorganic anion transporter [Empedobacter]MBW1617667.1 SulP family inorganic anion transporter [Empedobacter falsenii]MBY0067011.1 SulP family inorganic anion transporter [Empedobacter falsenii]MDH0658012.1 SulP family inorganic anion transporter [Empedobacter sp. GD03865]MDH2206481.1 SulP family inorganic anion transporter [Empedobacter sp. GD03644]STD56119.1 Putative sulfate transporter ychM [Empedobacter falsenii]
MSIAEYLKFNQKINYKNEILAGLTVAMTMIPESLSFAILAGLSPLIGLYGAFIMGIVTAVFGGRPAMVAGGAGATVITLIALNATYGEQYIFAAVALAGVFQIVVGVFKLGRFVRLIPQPVMYGFLNGLAVVIFMSQIEQFKSTTNGITSWLSGTPFYTMAGLTLITVLIVYFFPKLTKIIPASLVAILVTFLLVIGFHIDTKTVGDIASIKGELPSFHIPSVPFTLETLKIILPYSIIMGSVGLIETLLTLTLVDEVTETKGSSNKECLAQGAANITNGFFGGMGGCAMIAQTFVNLDAGSRSRLGPAIGAITILIIILIGAPVIEKIPMAALVGVMMMVAISTFKWGFFKLITKMPKSDVFVSILVAIITIVLHNLALAVFVGVIVSALVFAWDNAKRIRARKFVDENGRKIYEIYGPLFFGSTSTFLEKFEINSDPRIIVIDLKESRIVDMSAIESLHIITSKYAQQDKIVILRHLSKDSIRLLENAKSVIEVNIEEDPTYNVMPK